MSEEITGLSIALAVVLVVAVGSFGGWAASRIDDRAFAREARSIRGGLTGISDRLVLEQNGSAVWDDAVLNLRAGNAPWIADNLAEWMSEYFSHDRIYILAADGHVVRAVDEGKPIDVAAFEEDKAAIEPLIVSLRTRMAKASEGLEDSTAAVTGLLAEDLTLLGGAQPAIVSVVPILPSTDAVLQAPGSEYLHVSIRFLDQSLADEIAQQYEITALSFETTRPVESWRVATPVLSAGGRIIGFFAWNADKPAFNLLMETAPAVGGGLVIAGCGVVFLLRRLKRTSTQLEESKARAAFLAFHDPLTGIPNRALFEDRLEQALANMRRTGAKLALHYVDLDRFKQVNDTLGHPLGDALIREAATRLVGLVEEVDTVARLGGDEFAIVQFHAADVGAAIALSRKIIDAFDAPFELAGNEARVGASVGVVVTDDTSAQGADLMRQADVALYEAKDSGRGRFQVFAGELDDALRERRALEADLRSTLSTGEGLSLVYQPILDCRSGQIAGAEALVRWEHKVRGSLSPADFIGLAEERGLIDQLGLWVMREACKFAASSTLPWVAVNVSPLQFRDERFANRVFDVLKETGLQAKRLEIEITEGLLLQNSPTIQSTLTILRASGVRVALDDFGTGYSSISYLRNHGIDKLKIDQSFTAQLGQGQEIDSIVKSIIDLARAMHMAVTAEGVETPEQRQLLEAMGCDQLQGYLLSRPLAREKLEFELLRVQPARPSAADRRPAA